MSRSPREGSELPYAGVGVGGGIAGPVQPGEAANAGILYSILEGEKLSRWKGERQNWQRTRASVRVGGTVGGGAAGPALGAWHV